MGLSYNDLSLLRFIQKRQQIPLAKVALQFQKNEISIRRAIEQINLYSTTDFIEIKKGLCISRISYSEFVSFIRRLSPDDYSSSYIERIRVMIISIFFNGYVNASSLYQQWGLSPTTKKQDTAHLRKLLETHGLTLIPLKKKGLIIEGDNLQLRFLVIDILHPLSEFTAENRIEARYANTPIERQSYELAGTHLQPVSGQAINRLNDFLTGQGLSLNYPSKKFLLLFLCIMEIRPAGPEINLSYRLPLAPLTIPFSEDPRENRLVNVALSMMNFSRSLDFPLDRRLWHTTEQFAEQVVSHLPAPFTIREDFLSELYNYAYREITLNHFHCTFVDKTVEYTKEQFPGLYESIRRYGVYYKAAFNFPLMDEHISTLTLLTRKHILRNRIIERRKQKIVIMTSINFERISFFLEQLSEHIAFDWVGTLNINEIHRLKELEYDCIICFSSRIYNLLTDRNLTVLRLNFYVDESDIDLLLSHGFTTRKHRFLTSDFIAEIVGKDEGALNRHLKENFRDYFV